MKYLITNKPQLWIASDNTLRMICSCVIKVLDSKVADCSMSPQQVSNDKWENYCLEFYYYLSVIESYRLFVFYPIYLPSLGSAEKNVQLQTSKEQFLYLTTSSFCSVEKKSSSFFLKLNSSARMQSFSFQSKVRFKSFLETCFSLKTKNYADLLSEP